MEPTESHPEEIKENATDRKAIDSEEKVDIVPEKSNAEDNEDESKDKVEVLKQETEINLEERSNERHSKEVEAEIAKENAEEESKQDYSDLHPVETDQKASIAEEENQLTSEQAEDKTQGQESNPESSKDHTGKHSNPQAFAKDLEDQHDRVSIEASEKQESDEPKITMDEQTDHKKDTDNLSNKLEDEGEIKNPEDNEIENEESKAVPIAPIGITEDAKDDKNETENFEHPSQIGSSNFENDEDPKMMKELSKETIEEKIYGKTIAVDADAQEEQKSANSEASKSSKTQEDKDENSEKDKIKNTEQSDGSLKSKSDIQVSLKSDTIQDHLLNNTESEKSKDLIEHTEDPEKLQNTEEMQSMSNSAPQQGSQQIENLKYNEEYQQSPDHSIKDSTDKHNLDEEKLGENMSRDNKLDENISRDNKLDENISNEDKLNKEAGKEENPYLTEDKDQSHPKKDIQNENDHQKIYDYIQKNSADKFEKPETNLDFRTKDQTVLDYKSIPKNKEHETEHTEQKSKAETEPSVSHGKRSRAKPPKSKKDSLPRDASVSNSLSLVPRQTEIMSTLESKLLEFERKLSSQQSQISSLQDQVQSKDDQIVYLSNQLESISMRITPIQSADIKQLPDSRKEDDFWQIPEDPGQNYSNLKLDEIVNKNDLWIFALERQTPALFQNNSNKKPGFKSNALTRNNYSSHEVPSRRHPLKRGSLDPLNKRNPK